MQSASTARSLVLGCAFVVASSPALQAQDLSVYRQFRLGMTVAEAPARAAAEQQSREDAEEAKHAKARASNKVAFKF